MEVKLILSHLMVEEDKVMVNNPVVVMDRIPVKDTPPGEDTEVEVVDMEVAAAVVIVVAEVVAMVVLVAVGVEAMTPMVPQMTEEAVVDMEVGFVFSRLKEFLLYKFLQMFYIMAHVLVFWVLLT